MRLRTLVMVMAVGVVGALASRSFARAADLPEGDSPAVVSPAGHLEIRLRGNVLSVRARHAPWNAVLDQLGRQTGILIHLDGSLDGTLTQEFEAPTIEQGLRRLFRDTDLVVLYEPGPKDGGASERPIRLRLYLNRGSAPAPHAESGDPAERDLFARLAALDAAAANGDRAALQRAILDGDRMIQQAAAERLALRDPRGAVAALARGLESGQPAQRLRALSLLHRDRRLEEHAVLSVLATALADDDMGVKRFAMHALAERGGPDATEHLRWALRDRDPSIRRMVLESVASVGHPDLRRRLLHDALADDDATVRTIAASWLDQAVPEAQ